MLLFKVFSDSGQERGELRKIRNHLNHREKEVKTFRMCGLQRVIDSEASSECCKSVSLGKENLF